ncbi:MAG: DMT family transporter [Alphaproteobacteria bacterium]|nr:DMT family transporter [Alphaproteobacteria bacterium]
MTSPATGAPQRQQHTAHGILLVLAAVFCFACQDALGKHLFATYSVPFVQAVRYGLNLVVISALYAPRLGLSLVRTNRPYLMITRGLALAVGSFTGGLALRAMPLAEVVSIMYLSPLILLVLAWPLLGERVRWFGWAAAGFGFSGLLLIVRPGSGLAPEGLFFAFLNLITAVAYPMLSRVLARTESTTAQMFYVGLSGAVFYGLQLPWTMPAAMPPLPDLAFMLALGLVSLLGHSLFTMAYARAPVSLLGPFTYAHIAWATLLGWLVFAQVPDALTMLGIALIGIAGVGNAAFNHAASRKPVEIGV